jgi:hypothetical protein
MPSATTNAESGTNSKNKNSRKVGEATRYISRNPGNTFHGQATQGNKRRKLKKVWGGPFKKALTYLKASKYHQLLSKELNVPVTYHTIHVFQWWQMGH